MSTNEYNFSDVFQAIYISKQKPAPAAVAEEMKVILQSYPPLGQVTTVENGDIALTAVLEVPCFRADEPWEVAVWHSSDDSEWTSVDLFPLEDVRAPKSLQLVSESISRFYFVTALSFERSCRFTLKFRHGQNEEWRWIRDEQGLGDGTVIATPKTILSSDLADLIPDLNPAWKVSPCLSQSPGTKVWALESSIPSANGDDSAQKDVRVGVPWGSFLRWFALVRLWSPWLAPRHGRDHFELDKDSLLCSFLGPQGSNLVFLATSGLNNVLSIFQSSPEGGLSVHARNDGLTEGKAVILVSEGRDFECAVAAVMYQARDLVMQAQQANAEWDKELATLNDSVKPEWMENWYDGLGFCTWNALGQKLTDQKVYDAVDKLAEHNIKVTSLIIDDNWQSIDYKGPGQFQHGWKDFEAESSAFPEGLKATVGHIRKKHPHIQHIAVWHALLGYWAGISPEGKIAKTYKTVEVVREDAERRNLPLGGKMTVVAKEDVPKFYDDFYRFLSDCGVDAVKTDAQFMIDTWVGASARRELITTYLDAWTISSLRHFSAKVISCMSQIPQALFYSQMPRDRPTILVRNSDDFFPEISASHPWHVWTNAHNSIFTQHLNVLPDWDMFQTVHDYSGFHAAARCVSGGPIYITDVPGEHNMDLIGQMTGTTPRGKTIIFRPSVVGKTVYPYMGYDDDSLLKVGSYHGASQTGNPILAVFNISARPLTELIPISSFPGTHTTVSYVIRAHTTGNIIVPPKIGEEGSLITASLPVRGYEIFSAFPLSSISGRTHRSVQIANLGLLGKMTGAAAIVASSIEQRENGRVLLDTRIKALGTLGVYISTLDNMRVRDDFMVTIQEKPIPFQAVFQSKLSRQVLEIDTELAWKSMDLDSGWSNEIEIKVYFSV